MDGTVQHYQGRCGNADAYLASEQSRWVTRQVLGVDRGMSLHVHDYERLSRTVYGDELVDACKKSPVPDTP